jgi:broad specificity phosphatase PhoE
MKGTAIVLARHGRPDFQRGKWIAPRELPDWIARYDGAGIVDEPPDEAVRHAVALFRLAWFCGFDSRAETASMAAQRAGEGAEKLISLAQEAEAVFLVGHGVMNSLIAKQLLTRGARGPRLTHSRYWDCSIYRM